MKIRQGRDIIKKHTPWFTVLLFCLFSPFRAFSQETGADVNILRDTFLSLIKMGSSINDAYDNIVKAIYGDCKTCTQIVADHVSNCWSCYLVEKIFNAVDVVSTGVYEIVSGPSRVVLTVLLGLWLLYHVGKHIMSFSPQEPADFWTKTGRILFKAMFAGALLSMPISYVSNLLISPIIVGAVEFNQVIIKSYASLDERNEDFVREDKIQAPLFYDSITKDQRNILRLLLEGGQISSDIMSSIPLFIPIGVSTHTAYGLVLKWLDEMDAYENLSLKPTISTMSGCSLSLAEPDLDEGRMLNTQIYNALWCLTEMLHKEISFGMSFASAIICQSWHAASYIIFNGPDFGMLISGIMIWGTCLILLVIFVFKVLDAIIRLGIIGSILPFLIIAWVFPSSMSYAKQGFKILVHIVMNFIVLAIVIALAMLMVMHAFQLDDGDLRQMCMLNNVQGLRDSMDLSGASFLFAFACCFFGIKALSVVDRTAREYTEVEIGSQAGDKIGVMASYVTAKTLQGAATLMALSVKKVNEPERTNDINMPPDKQKDLEDLSKKPKLPQNQTEVMDKALYDIKTGKFKDNNASLLNLTDDQFDKIKEIADQLRIVNDNRGRYSYEERSSAEMKLSRLERQLEYQRLKQRYYDKLTEGEKSYFAQTIDNIKGAREAVPDTKDRLEYTKYLKARSKFIF